MRNMLKTETGLTVAFEAKISKTGLLLQTNQVKRPRPAETVTVKTDSTVYTIYTASRAKKYDVSTGCRNAGLVDIVVEADRLTPQIVAEAVEAFRN